MANVTAVNSVNSVNQTQYQLDEEKLKLNPQHQTTWQNLQSCEILVSMLRTVNVRLDSVEAVLRAIDFIGGVHNELRKALIDSGVLYPTATEKPQTFTDKLKATIAEENKVA